MSTGIVRKNPGAKNGRRQSNGAPAAQPLVLKLSQFTADHFTVHVRHGRLPLALVKAAKNLRDLGGPDQKKRRHPFSPQSSRSFPGCE